MLSAIAIIPSAPVMVAQLAGVAAAEVADLHAAVIEAARTLPDRWVVVGAGGTDDVLGPELTGTFAGYGVDVPVALGPAGSVGDPAELPLAALIAGWVRGQANSRARLEVHVYADTHSVDDAVERGRRLRAEIDRSTGSVGVLAVADGAHTLTPPAPGGYDPASVPLQGDLDDALSAGDAAALSRLPAAIVGRVAYQVLAGLEPAPRAARELYRGAPYGVGYFVGVWQPAGRSAATGESVQ